ncbi:MAG: hypothetical protein CVU42_12635 [Chloroflexi bacterium HGW-Chloroflexi-4]|jgi:hypothetical protein|nr:MAG: hypothetical protein CVU42_12635 [Chloroflexi bacterium HGW-Chloroflexi-4]PKO00248.1 MAG: hypothetical protein CVU43_14330 [Chloroflexi bacterium HGW-Chloroflexi-5]
MSYTLKSKLGDLLKDAVAVKVVEKYAPGITTNPMIGLAKGMALDALLAMPQAKQYGITKEMVLRVLAEIETIKNK